MKLFFRIRYFLYLIILIFSSCAYGPKDPDRTFAQKLNGNNYQEQASVGSVPIVKRSVITKKISGKVYCGKGPAQSPVNNATVSIANDKDVLFATSTITDGSYVLPASLDSGVVYTLSAKAACGKDSKKVTKTASDEIPNENLFLKK